MISDPGRDQIDDYISTHFDASHYDTAAEAAFYADRFRATVRRGWRTEAELLAELREAMAAGVETGSDVEPGAYIDHTGAWKAWGYGIGRDGMISVTEGDLA